MSLSQLYHNSKRPQAYQPSQQLAQKPNPLQAPPPQQATQNLQSAYDHSIPNVYQQNGQQSMQQNQFIPNGFNQMSAQQRMVLQNYAGNAGASQMTPEQRLAMAQNMAMCMPQMQPFFQQQQVPTILLAVPSELRVARLEDILGYSFQSKMLVIAALIKPVTSRAECYSDDEVHRVIITHPIYTKMDSLQAIGTAVFEVEMWRFSFGQRGESILQFPPPRNLIENNVLDINKKIAAAVLLDGGWDGLATVMPAFYPKNENHNPAAPAQQPGTVHWMPPQGFAPNPMPPTPRGLGVIPNWSATQFQNGATGTAASGEAAQAGAASGILRDVCGEDEEDSHMDESDNDDDDEDVDDEEVDGDDEAATIVNG